MRRSQVLVWHPSGVALTFTLFFPSTAPALTENAVYPGAAPISNIPNAGTYDVVGPSGSTGGKSTCLSDNVITVNGSVNAPTAYDYSETRHVFDATNFNGSATAAVTDNTVAINGGTLGVFIGIFGGTSTDGAVSGNRVSISGNTVLGSADLGTNVYGGWSTNSNAIGNSVVISGNADVEGNVRSGRTDDFGNANNNTVTIGGGAMIGDIRDGHADHNAGESNYVF